MRPEGCICADIADEVGNRLDDPQIAALCDRLRPQPAKQTA